LLFQSDTDEVALAAPSLPQRRKTLQGEMLPGEL
jgi:hypothetical protein